MISNAKFKTGSGVYICENCGKKTRDVRGESSVGICAKCYEISELNNAFNDGLYTQEEYDNELEKIEAKYER